MKKHLKARIILPSNVIFDEDIDMATLPGEQGVFGVLAGHMPFIAELKSGLIKIKYSSERRFYIHDGIAKIENNELSILTDFAVDITNANNKDIKDNINEFEKKLEKIEDGDLEYRIISDKIEKNSALLKFLS